ncbi:MAG: hypothetical protein P4L53_10135 [Candidatus Obscuribacterales bacterium]|nr:hypothetical protein [Candidatus Obscuribacterales bacterium]
MKTLPIFNISVLAALFVIGANPAHAGWGKLKITDGAGNGVEAHSYPLGLGKGFTVQDANGDEYSHQKGILGFRKSTKANLFGNGVKVSHNPITGTSVKGQDMFGDSFKSKRFLGIGPQITTVNASGMHNVIGNIMHPNPQGPYPMAPNNYGANFDPQTGAPLMAPNLRPELPNP